MRTLSCCFNHDETITSLNPQQRQYIHQVAVNPLRPLTVVGKYPVGLLLTFCKELMQSNLRQDTQAMKYLTIINQLDQGLPGIFTGSTAEMDEYGILHHVLDRAVDYQGLTSNQSQLLRLLEIIGLFDQHFPELRKQCEQLIKTIGSRKIGLRQLQAFIGLAEQLQVPSDYKQKRITFINLTSQYQIPEHIRDTFVVNTLASRAQIVDDLVLAVSIMLGERCEIKAQGRVFGAYYQIGRFFVTSCLKSTLQSELDEFMRNRIKVAIGEDERREDARAEALESEDDTDMGFRHVNYDDTLEPLPANRTRQQELDEDLLNEGERLQLGRQSFQTQPRPLAPVAESFLHKKAVEKAFSLGSQRITIQSLVRDDGGLRVPEKVVTMQDQREIDLDG